MNRFRGTDVALGLVAVAVNVGLVVGVVAMTGDDDPAEGSAARSPSAGATASPSPTAPSPSPTASPTPSVPSARSLFTGGGPVSVAVLGDQTGDGEAEWVGVVSALLGTDRQVVLRDLDPSDPTVYAGERTFGTSGPKVSVHNASRAGVRADYAARRLPLLVPVKADLVILNYGRNDPADKVAGRLEKTAEAIREQLPDARVVVTLQPPTAGDGQQDVRTAVRRWAKASDLPVLDVATAFRETGAPDSYVSGRDPLVMSSLGDELWGQEVYRLLTGQRAPVGGEAGPTPDATDAGDGTATTDGAAGSAAEPTDVDPTSTSDPTDPAADPSPTASTAVATIPVLPGRPPRPTATASPAP